MKARICKHCDHFYIDKKIVRGLMNGECREDSPNGDNGGWPMTQQDKWCGKFIIRVERAISPS